MWLEKQTNKQTKTIPFLPTREETEVMIKTQTKQTRSCLEAEESGESHDPITFQVPNIELRHTA